MPKNKIINFLDKYHYAIIAVISIVILFPISLFMIFFAIFFNSNKYSIVERKNQNLHYILSSGLSLLLTLVIVSIRFVDKSNYHKTWNSQRWYHHQTLKMAKKLCKDKSVVPNKQHKISS